MDLRHLEGLGECERREDGGKPLGQHGFSSARRSDQKDVMTTRRRNLQGPFDRFLSLHLAEIEIVVVRLREQRVHLGGKRGDGGLALEEACGLPQVEDGNHLQPPHDRGLGRVVRGNHHALPALRLRPQCDGQGPLHGTHGPGERELADDEELIQAIRLHLLACLDDSERNGEIKAGPFLPHIRRGEIDGGPAQGNAEPGAAHGGEYAIEGFPHRGVGQADDDGTQIAHTSGMHLHLNGKSLYAENRRRAHLGQHAASVWKNSPRQAIAKLHPHSFPSCCPAATQS